MKLALTLVRVCECVLGWCPSPALFSVVAVFIRVTESLANVTLVKTHTLTHTHTLQLGVMTIYGSAKVHWPSKTCFFTSSVNTC